MCKPRLNNPMLLLLLATLVFGMWSDAASAMSMQAPTGEFIAAKQSSGRFMTAGSVEGKFTMQTVTRPDAGWTTDENGSQVFLLAGFANTPGGNQLALAVTWSADVSGWIPRWVIRLNSDNGLQPVSIPAGKTVPNSIGVDQTELAAPAPTPGHEYQCLLSYDQTAGEGSVAIIDATSGMTIYAGGFRTKKYAGPLYPVYGYSGTQAASVDQKAVTLAPIYMPVGVKWSLCSPDSDRCLSNSLFQVDEQPHLQLSTPIGQVDGQYRVWLGAPGTGTLLTSIPGVAGSETQITLPSLPIGASTVTLEYVAHDMAWTDPFDVVVGQARVYSEPLQVSRADRSVGGTLHLSAKGLSAIPLTVQAIVQKMVWDAGKRSYQYQDFQTTTIFDGKANSSPSSDEALIRYNVPYPPEKGLYRLKLQARSSLGANVQTDTQDYIFDNYDPAHNDPGEPFTIAVIPDSQYHVRHYPEIFIRQNQWIAENAAERNIAVVLHVGDITDQNNTTEWVNAARGLKLLDNASIPYVLAVGNHDLLRPQDNWVVTNWDASQINSYFPLQSFVNLGGTFSPGRVENSFHTFTLGGQDYLILSLEFMPRDAVATWANEVITSHPNHKVIIVTHTYLWTNGGRSTPGFHPAGTNGGLDLWRKLVLKNKNVILVLSGHYPATTVPYKVDSGAQGNTFLEALFDYQSEPNGGNGWLGLLEFWPDGKINVKCYSPYLGIYNTSTDQYGFNNNFSIQLSDPR